MAAPTKIQHPLLRRPGSSQPKRNADGFALQKDYTLIDGRSLGDLLDYIHQYARQVVFPELKIDKAGDAYAELSNWLAFFEKSLPFRLAQFGKKDFDRLEEDLAEILETIARDPSAHNLGLLVDFCFYELVFPIAELERLVDEHEFDLKPYLKSAIRASLVSPLRRYTQLSNTTGAYFCVGKHRFTDFTKDPWNISIQDTFAIDSSVTQVPGGPAGAVLWLKEEVAATTREMLQALRKIGREVPNHLSASLQVLQNRHEPHLGLLFTFFRLFSPFQSDLNEVTQKHLDFFYQDVLKIRPKGSVPDKAHLIFEIANHLEKYPIKQGTVFKDGKDARNADILFQLDDEVVIDKAQVKELKTLYLNTTQDCSNEGESSRRSVIEGVYIAPIANSADGKGTSFKEDQSKNWATLGAKTSKFVAPGKDKPENHPFGRIGFVLASPVLWLNEGKRDVIITIESDAGGNTDIFTDCFKRNIEAFSKEKLYKISEQTIIKIENLFSLKARAFLQDKLDRNLLLESDELKDREVFSKREADILDQLLEKADSDGRYVLREMPFASLVRYFNLLRLQQDPYRIGFDAEGFLRAKDPVTCEPLVKESVRADIRELLDTEAENVDLFTLQFSGEKGWFEAKTKPDFTPAAAAEALTLFGSSSLVSLNIGSSAGARTVKLTFHALLGPDEPKVAFYDEDAVKEHFKLERPFPMVKIELNPEVQLACENHCEQGQCCLQMPDKRDKVIMALYQFFRDLKVQTVDIKVMVCGMKNLIVQNEESLQDVNKPILPFGARPKVGADFYIGNKELFGKNWQTFWVYTIWKDKPNSLRKHYENYGPATDEGYGGAIGNYSFRFESAVLENRKWLLEIDKAREHTDRSPGQPKRLLRPIFRNFSTADLCGTARNENSAYYQEFRRNCFHKLEYNPKSLEPSNLAPLNVNSERAFFRMRLEGVSFQHHKYPFVLARKLFQLSGKLDQISIADILEQVNKAIDLRNAIKDRIDDVKDQIKELVDINKEYRRILDPDDKDGLTQLLDKVESALNAIRRKIEKKEIPSIDDAKDALELLDGKVADPTVAKLIKQLRNSNNDLARIINTIKNLLGTGDDVNEIGVMQLLKSLEGVLEALQGLVKPIEDLGLPNEPYTPMIKSIEIDYCATADNNDIELIHLYPFVNSSKTEHLELGPTLLPTFVNEGTLFIGLDKIRPGGGLHLLFQFAEATADSESERADINWHYLTGNRWQPLRTGFEILSDDTDRLARSGIVKIAVPRDISNVDNTLMPPTEEGKHLYWLKVSAPKSVAAVAELFGVHAQAASVAYQPLPNSDSNRVGEPLEPNKIGKPLEPDFSIKKVEQPYESFGGRLAEAEGHLYTRVSENLRHKGRSVDIFDFERLVLEAFPDLFKCKCISHTMGLSANEYRRDLEVAPGFITVAVVPDLRKLKPGEVSAPKAPVSLLAKVKDYLQQRVSPFARIRVMNPRYEKIGVDVKVRLVRGRDETYYTAQLKKDLTYFLAPWYLGDSDKLSFGQHVVYSDVIGFIENLEYVQFITDLELRDSEGVSRKEIVPVTARSILTAGEICIDLDRENCNEPPAPSPVRAKADSRLGKSVSFSCGKSRPFLGGGYRKGAQPVEAP